MPSNKNEPRQPNPPAKNAQILAGDSGGTVDPWFDFADGGLYGFCFNVLISNIVQE